jgi:Uma2 family endonuclease
MSRQIKSYITPEEYLELERKADYKSEYLHGEVFAMTGASRQHNLIGANISRTLGNQLLDRPCELYVNDMRVKVSASGLYTYPDVTVVCGEPKFEDVFIDTLLNPTLLIEILSKSTERYDRIAKTDYYRTLDSLAEHLLVAQEEYRIEQYTRQPDGSWILAETPSLEEIVDLGSIDCSLALVDVYKKVALG